MPLDKLVRRAYIGVMIVHPKSESPTPAAAQAASAGAPAQPPVGAPASRQGSGDDPVAAMEAAGSSAADSFQPSCGEDERAYQLDMSDGDPWSSADLVEERHIEDMMASLYPMYAANYGRKVGLQKASETARQIVAFNRSDGR